MIADGSGLRRTLAATVRAGGHTVGTFVSLGSAMAVEVCALAQFDWLLIDLEHGAGTETELPGQLQAADAHGMPVVVRTETFDRIRAGRALDMGAAGIMLPRIGSAQEAAAAVTDLRYPPVGGRGVANYNRARRFGLDTRTLAEVDDDVLVVVQIESIAALRDIDGIASRSGADVLFVGPQDLAAALGVPGRLDAPEFQAALRTTLDAAAAHGIVAGILAADATAAQRYRDQGFRFVAVGSDATLLLAAGRAVTAALTERQP